MIRRRWAAALWFLATPGVAATSAEVIQRVNDLMRGQTSAVEMSMTIVTPSWTRTLDVAVWTKGRTTALVRVKAPARDAGSGSLRLANQLWNWIPRVERTIKVPPSMMLQGWMGSDFTYHDIVKSDSLITDYTWRLTATRTETARTIYTVEGTPRPDAPVVWGRVVVAAAEEGPDLYPLKEEDYSERGELSRSITFSDVRRFGALLRPARMEIVPHRKPGRRTVVVHHAMAFDAVFPDGFFSLRTLEQGRERALLAPAAP